ncbi:major allergen Pru ar 1-like [Jatropha curcas]|uniref:Major allergen Pru ar n=1 Tax=Jatropha curcas TaxID=180498 RepID=E9JFV7_JATCU|nr:major allergen Pru ar 1-like [Jatropha curcas]ADU56176.1 major allergen Pru ar [Jatropha curcas]
MAILTTQTEIATAVPPAKLYKALLLEAHVYAPKILPQSIKSIVLLQGDGGVGTIKQTDFKEGFGVYLKVKVDAVDEGNLKYIYTAFEGEPWVDTVEKATYEAEVVATPGGGSIYKATNKYYPKGNAEIDPSKIKEAEDMTDGFVKAVEAYLVANPDA